MTNLTIATRDHVTDRASSLAALLQATVHDGGAIGFVLPLPDDDARDFWRSIAEDVGHGRRVLFLAEVDGALAGSVQLIAELPPNQPHRSEVAKLMVHPDFRRRGVASALMRALEAHARALGKTLITLDTRTGDSAETLYAALGFETAGVIPNYALDPDRQNTHATTYMFKHLN